MSGSFKPILETRRLLLRPFRDTDAQALLDPLADPEVNRAYLGSGNVQELRAKLQAAAGAGRATQQEAA